MKQKRVLTVQDISCFGKSSITVALPVISAFGAETVILPTAVLSTHTGGFSGYTYHDLTLEIEPILSHWKSLGLTFDAIYTGYLGSEELIQQVSVLIDQFAQKDTIVFIDPVLGDRGKPYPGFGKSYIRGYQSLCRKAHLISPNVTEACLLTGTPYRENAESGYYKELAQKLLSLGARQSVLTGAFSSGGGIGCIGWDRETKENFSVYRKKIDAPLHGTGDVFSSALIGAMVNGLSFRQSTRLAVDFVTRAIRETTQETGDYWYGVKFESCLQDTGKLLRHYGKEKK